MDNMTPWNVAKFPSLKSCADFEQVSTSDELTRVTFIVWTPSIAP